MKAYCMIKMLVVLAAAMTCVAQSSTQSPTVTTASAPTTQSSPTTLTPVTPPPTDTTSTPPSSTSATTKPSPTTSIPPATSNLPTTPVIPISVKPGSSAPTIPPNGGSIISSIPTPQIPSSMDELAQSLTPTTTHRPSPNSSSNTTSTDTSSPESFFRIDNGAMWGAFAGATFIGAVIVVVLLRQSNNPHNGDRSSSPYSPARPKHTNGNSAADKRPWQTPGVVQTLEPSCAPPTIPVTVKSVPHAYPPPPPQQSSRQYTPPSQQHSPMYHGNAQTPMARVNRKQSAVPMLEPTYRGRGDDEDGYDNHDRYSFESDDMNIRHTAPGDKIRSQGGRHENWATGMTSHKRKVSVADSEGDIGDARMSYASTAMFERDSTATSRYSNSFTGGPPPMVPGQPSRLPVRDSYEL